MNRVPQALHMVVLALMLCAGLTTAEDKRYNCKFRLFLFYNYLNVLSSIPLLLKQVVLKWFLYQILFFFAFKIPHISHSPNDMVMKRGSDICHDTNEFIYTLAFFFQLLIVIFRASTLS